MIVTIGNTKGGVGKTTIAINLFSTVGIFSGHAETAQAYANTAGC